MARQLFQENRPLAPPRQAERPASRWFMRVKEAAKGQLILFEASPLRYVIDAVVPFGGIAWDVLISPRNIFVEMKEGGGGKNLLQVFARNYNAYRKTGLPQAPLLARPFTRAFWGGVKEKKEWSQQDFAKFYAEKEGKLKGYLLQMRQTRQARLAASRTQQVIRLRTKSSAGSTSAWSWLRGRKLAPAYSRVERR